ncbi:MAG: hypothetical protein P9L88_01180 [Candidatus Tantalella remota]|nr:hypothetical protein [Candidatus Tantalella remota]
MKKVLAIILVLAIALSCTPAFAASKGMKGPSASALANASDRSAVDKVGDWIATRGKTSNEAQKVIAERQTKRMAKKAEKEARKKAKQAEKQAKKTSKDMKGKFGKK